MALVSMKRTKKEVKDANKLLEVGSREEYPWGLEISLHIAELRKLGLDPAKMKAGAMVNVRALGKVTRLSISDDFNNGSNGSASVRLQKLEIVPQGKPDELDWDTSAKDAEAILHKRGVIKG